jgi:hypothetical protein
MSVGVWIQVGRDFTNFCKPFGMKVERRKVFFNNFLEEIFFD